MKRDSVLIVEDELLIAKDITDILSQADFNVLDYCTTVRQGLRMIQEIKPNLVLIDIHLSDHGDGIEIGEYLIQKDEIPFIYITSHTDRITLDRAKNTRPHGYVVKPFKPKDLLTTVEIVLNNFSYRQVDVKRNAEILHSDVPLKIRNIINFIEINIEKKLTVQELAEQIGWNTQHFIRNFKKYTKKTPYQFILEVKVSRAEALLLETDIPAVEVAFELGFESYSNFSTAFKKFKEMTPEEYRKVKKFYS